MATCDSGFIRMGEMPCPTGIARMIKKHERANTSYSMDAASVSEPKAPVFGRSLLIKEQAMDQKAIIIIRTARRSIVPLGLAQGHRKAVRQLASLWKCRYSLGLQLNGNRCTPASHRVRRHV